MSLRGTFCYQASFTFASGSDIQFSTGPNLPPSADHISGVAIRSMTPGTVPALGMRLLYGRNFSGRTSGDENTVIVNETLATNFGGGPGSLGRYIKCLTWPPAQIAGVVTNVHEETLLSGAVPTAYFPFSQWGVADADLVIRTTRGVPTSDALHSVEASVRAVEPRAAISHFAPLKEMVESAGTMTRYTAYYLLVLAVLSAFLAVVCSSLRVLAELHRRKTEIGIRMALGASPGDIIGLFVYSELFRGGIAALLGAVFAWWLSQLLSHLLYDVKTTDPLSFFIGVMTPVALIAVTQVSLLKRELEKNPRDLL